MDSDSSTNIADIKGKIKEFVVERDWEKFHNPKDLAASISIESAELLEIFQWKSESEVTELEKDPKLRNKISEELADIIIYGLSLANRLDIDVTSTVMKKIEKNSGKYPVEKSYGSAKKYTEF